MTYSYILECEDPSLCVGCDECVCKSHTLQCDSFVPNKLYPVKLLGHIRNSSGVVHGRIGDQLNPCWRHYDYFKEIKMFHSI